MGFEWEKIMSKSIFELINERWVLIAAHRGYSGGNIPCNSMGAFKAALNFDADIVELDVNNSSDGELFIQHPGMEYVHLRMRDSINEYTQEVVSNFRLSNVDVVPTEYNILRFEEALDFLKGKCYINVDKFWANPEKIAKIIRAKGMEDQVIIKVNYNEKEINDAEKYAPDIPLMTVVWKEDESLEIMKNRNIRFIGTECLFESEDDPIASPEYIEKMHDNNKLLWVNAIVYYYKTLLCAGHTDDISVTEDPENGWGWLCDRGFDIIQTDWLTECDMFLKKTNRRK